ncbi:hypothetical protein HMN09_00373500 [Mycena chlorophos]|uniref:DUF6532 domain-containing protein n=1 Tax=Mycena chlorophos TaxID=658473 RepID=A0A8H6TJ16_MYCCL|nr:hypothetical protein HMN09_00373500 [Mycena chlorophos]
MVPKLASYFQFTAVGTTPAHIRIRVKTALKDQSYLFPVTFSPAPPSVDGDSVGDTRMQFATDKPLHAAPIVEVIQEVFFSPKGFGKKFSSLFRSYNDKYPSEPELPTPLLALVATYMCGALYLWEHGRKQKATSFTQETLETTYTDIVQFIETTRRNSPEGMHRLMHALFRSAKQSRDGAVVNDHGSASNILTLAPEPAAAM